jgi:hypothetical protein
MGAAIFNRGGTVTITDSTLYANDAYGGGGYVSGTGLGGGLFNLDGAVTITDSTFAGNLVGNGAQPDGGAIYQYQWLGTATLNLTNTILANSTGGSELVNNGGTVSGDHNLVMSSSGVPDGVIVSTADPLLGPLQNNGGRTPTMALLPLSPAIDAGDNSVLGPPLNLTTDQRGLPRPDVPGTNPDIGAFEFQVNAATIATNASQVGNVVGSAVLSDSATLSDGVMVDAGGATITFSLTAPDSTTTSFAPVAVTGDGTYSSPTVTATEVGTYTWHASYSGNSFNNGVTDDGSNESLATIKATPTIVSTSNPTGTVVVGTTAITVSDSAVVSGGYYETGSLVFTLTGPGGFSFSHSDTLNGNNTYAVSTMIPASAGPGTYTWTVTYAGDANNNPNNDQGGSAEQFTLQNVVTSGEAATKGFWANNNGQALLKTYTTSAIGNWLATTCPNLFGNLSGATGSQFGTYYLALKGASGQTNTTMANVMSTALSVWVTTTGLGWNTSATGPTFYGFHQGFGGVGLGSILYNVGSNGASFGVANNTYLTVNQILAYFNGRTVRTGGTLTKLPTWMIYGVNTRLLYGANAVYGGINQTGDIV